MKVLHHAHWLELLLVQETVHLVGPQEDLLRVPQHLRLKSKLLRTFLHRLKRSSSVLGTVNLRLVVDVVDLVCGEDLLVRIVSEGLFV